MPVDRFKLDLNEKFKRLSQPPIVEAVIHWQARTSALPDVDSLKARLAELLPEYTRVSPVQEGRTKVSLSSAGGAPQIEYQGPGLVGLRLNSDDGCHSIQFLRDGLVFSRTKSYQHWDEFATAAKRAWQVFVEIARPAEIHRLGVRYINRLAAATPETLSEILREPPTCPSDLPLIDFVYQSTFAVPNAPFDVRVIKVMQRSMPELRESTGLFLDIDVYTRRPLPLDAGALDEALETMRWLKNKVFFSLLTDDAVRSFGPGGP